VNDMTAALSTGTQERERIGEIRSRYQRLEEIGRLVRRQWIGHSQDRRGKHP
jgi:hypothetical protein